MVLWKLKSCPRCAGDVFIDKEQETWYAQCLQCGYLCGDLFCNIKVNQYSKGNRKAELSTQRR